MSCVGDGAFLKLRVLSAGLMLAILGLSLQGSAVAPELAASATNRSAYVDTGGNCLRYWHAPPSHPHRTPPLTRRRPGIAAALCEANARSWHCVAALV